MEASNLLQIGRFAICAHDFPPAFGGADAARRPFYFVAEHDDHHHVANLGTGDNKTAVE
jgi:hypothetical protein